MDLPLPRLLILADAPDALVGLFGISLLERLLRTLQRLGFRHAVIGSNTCDEIANHLAKPSWARAEVALDFVNLQKDKLSFDDLANDGGRALIVDAGYYYDARLLKALTGQLETALLIDSDPPPTLGRLSRSAARAALITREALRAGSSAPVLLDELASAGSEQRIKTIDAATQPAYVASMRRHIRPVIFSAPSPGLVPVAEKFIRDTAQNGVLDFPGFLDSPIEDRIVSWLCRTSLRPNYVTLVTMAIGIAVTVLFATGHLWPGVILAYCIEVLDGVDGKLARTKVETTTVGEWEHLTDYFIELSWWAGLAFHFYDHGVPFAFGFLALYVGSDIVDRLAKRAVKRRVHRNLDDVSNFDRFVRCIGARRNINIWILIAAMVLGDAPNGFVLFCCWGAATAFAHLVRAFQLRTSAALL
jgi:hypothetical protein